MALSSATFLVGTTTGWALLFSLVLCFSRGSRGAAEECITQLIPADDSAEKCDDANVRRVPWSSYETAEVVKGGQDLASVPAGDLRFVFGESEAVEDLQLVHAEDDYSETKGFGFESRSQNTDANCASINGWMRCKPFYFSVALPEGNYRVKLVSDGSPLTVKAELRRLMFWEVDVPAPPTATAEFTVNVRTASIDDKQSVRLKAREREKEYWAWDEKLTLEFNGPKPCVKMLTITPEPDAITVFLTGDSTVTDQPSAPWGSWGQMLPYFFRPGVAVANYAQSGESVASSLGAGRFDKVFSLMKPGDHLLIQFGHNDMKNDRPDALSDYRKNLTSIVNRTRILGGVPVLLTSMERKPGRRYVSLGEYPQAVREVAAEYRVPLIDLNEMSHKLYKALGKDLDHAFQDGSHHTVYGSFLLAKCVVMGIINNELTLTRLVNDRIGSFDPTKPDPLEEVLIPTSPQVSMLKPEGS